MSEAQAKKDIPKHYSQQYKERLALEEFDMAIFCQKN